MKKRIFDGGIRNEDVALVQYLLTSFGAIALDAINLSSDSLSQLKSERPHGQVL